MLTFLDRCPVTAQGTITFLYHDNGHSPMPAVVTDPLDLLGDIDALSLDDCQRDALRECITHDLRSEGAEEVWRTRALRKNVIHSFGIIV